MILPTLRQLQYLAAVIETLNFSRAAELCHVTQSTLSAGIQELESILGSPLLERNKRRVMPTPLGERVVAEARDILERAEAMVVQAKGLGEPLAGPLRLGVIPTVGPFLLPRVLGSIRRAFPRLRPMLLEDPSARLLERLGAGSLDVAILAFPYPTHGFETEVFWQENFQVALPSGHPLAGRAELSTGLLPSDELLLLEEGHCLTDHALAACHLEGLKSAGAFQGTSLYTLLEMVAGGQGITFLPDMAAGAALVAGADICLAPLAEPGPHRRLGLVWRSTWPRKDDFSLLARTMREILSMSAKG